jgi:glutamine cyclotransferase
VQKDTLKPIKKGYSLKVIRTINHDPDAFTQGLIYHNGFLYESTGLKEHSTLRKLDIKTGKVLKIEKIPDQYFSEGITIFGKNIYMLTWVSNVCFVFDLETFKQKTSFNYFGEGWGLTNDKDHLIMSDGTNVLRFINPSNFEEIKMLNVTDGGLPVKNINELEYINGEIFANIWMTDMIARIDPETGDVSGWLDLSALRDYVKDNPKVEVLNGIAYNKEKDLYYLTGKYWPYIFEVELVNK